jgi:hypothetical protein
VLRGDCRPVAAGAQLAKEREHLQLHAPGQQRGRRKSHAPQQRKPWRARRVRQPEGSTDIPRFDPAKAAGEEPLPGRRKIFEQRGGIVGLGLGKVPQACQGVIKGVRICVDDRPHGISLALQVLGVEAAQQREVQ